MNILNIAAISSVFFSSIWSFSWWVSWSIFDIAAISSLFFVFIWDLSAFSVLIFSSLTAICFSNALYSLLQDFNSSCKHPVSACLSARVVSWESFSVAS